MRGRCDQRRKKKDSGDLFAFVGEMLGRSTLHALRSAPASHMHFFGVRDWETQYTRAGARARVFSFQVRSGLF